ncbi:MAG: hypothetical protein HOP23_08985 [Methylococcaceae bacterium]|nr:hypothetical protein [Methylococcaceae bacterium]
MIFIIMLRAVCFLLPLVFLTGCAVSSTIEIADTSKSEFDGAIYGGKTSSINAPLLGIEKHRIFHQGSTGFTSVETIRNSALERAEFLCSKRQASSLN